MWKNKKFDGILYKGSYVYKGQTRVFVLNWVQAKHRRLAGKYQFYFQSFQDAKAHGWKKVRK